MIPCWRLNPGKYGKYKPWLDAIKTVAFQRTCDHNDLHNFHVHGKIK